MKHLKLFFALFAILALGVGNAWGAEQTVKWTATSGALGNGIGSGTIKTGTYEWNYTRTLISGTSYTGWNSSCIQLGKNGGVENITFTTSAIPGTIKSVAVECSSYNNAHKVSIAVGGTTYLAATATAKWTTVGTKTGTGSSTGTINISFTGGTRALYIKSITVIYEETSSGGTEPVLSSIEISGDLTKKTYEEGDELDLAGLTVNAIYDDASTKVVTNDVEWSYTPNPLTQGTTSVDITASYEEKTVTKPITGLTVNEHIVTPDEYCIVPNNAFWGTNYNGSDANAATTLFGTQNDISILHTKSGNNLYVNNTQTRVYTNHAMQISVPLGYVITSIAFTADGSNWAGTHTANVGTMTDSKNWAGIANEVTITFGGTCRITKICVNYIKDAKYVLTITEPTEGGTLVVKDGENTLTSGAEIYEGTKLTVTATPETGYEDGVVVVKNASDEDITATVYADGVLTMPAYPVTISATFEKKPCELLAKPTVSATTTYSSAALTWEAVANAAKYSVKVGTADAVETTETSYDVTGLTAETTYTYQVQAIAEADQDTYCDSEVAEGTFTTTAAPVATLTLKDIVGTTTLTGSLNGTITLPTEAAECSKTFVGWDADENCNHAPTYAPGAEYTFTTQYPTLYAVYADGEGGGNFTITKTMSEIVAENEYTVSEGTNVTCYTSLTLDENITLSTTGEANCGSFWKDPREWRLYQNKSGNAIVTASDGCSLTSVKFTFSVDKTGTLLNAGVAMQSGIAVSASDKSATYTVGNSKNDVTNGQVKITAIEVSYSKEGEYSNYSTTCAAALEKPTFSIEEGTYTEAKSIELSATEGDIYYTLDGTDPTASNTQYTTAIVLDECGTTTIKAIAIGAGSQSPVASATYIINLPITNTAATAYTPAEAIAIIDGECDKTEEVFVKGVVVSTSEFNATYGNYDVIVKAVDDNSATPTTFTFYRMYKAASNTKFTESDEVIGVGDIITAKGKLKKFNSTYELAEGCYMVERVAFTEPKTDISNTLETAYTVDKAFELISDVKSDLDKEVYVKGLVAVASTQLYEEKYLTYSISDNGQTTGNVLKVYDGLDIGGVAFTSKDDVKVGDYVVVKGKLLNYGGTYEINKDNQLVQHKKAATITIADITMEVGETKTIAATVTPEGASVSYEIKAGSDNCITLNVAEITATAAGTATIVATIDETADYLGVTKEFTVTVTTPDTRKKAVSPSPFTAVSGNMNPNDITYSSSKGGGTSDPTIKDNYIQLYQIASGKSYGGFITFNAVKGCKIDQVMIVTGNTTTTHIAYSVNDVMSATTENVQKNAEYITEAGLNAESVNIYCMHTNKDNRLFIASAIVYYTGQPLADPELSWTSNAVELQVGEAFTAPTLNNPNNVTGITYDSDNESLAKVNKTTGAVTLVPDAAGTATITAKFDGNETYKAANVSYTITVKSLPVSGVWVLITDANSLAAGDKVVIVAKESDYALSTTQNDNNRGQAAVTKNSDNTVAFGKDVQILTIETGTVDNTFALNTGKGYLYAVSSSSNHLKTQKSKDANASWKISITEGTASIVAQGTNTRNVMQYNQSSSLFACYGSASQNALCIYKKNHVKVSGDLNSDQITNSSDVTVLENGTLTVNNDIEIENLYIKTTMGTTTSGQISGATLHNLTINGDAFIDITLGKNGDPNQWHAFTVPFPVDAMNGVYDLNDNQLKNEVNYAIMDYHGDIRANGQYGWKKYRGILVPGTFYLMTVDGARTTYRFKKVKDADLVAPTTKTITAYTGSSDDTKDKGWNGVGNPTLMYGKVAVDAQILDPETYTYKTITASSAHFTVGTPFFIQAATDGTMTMVAETSASLAPARHAATAVENIKVMLGNSDYTDYLYVSASEDATNEYEIGKDLAKMTMTKTPSVPQIFAEAYNTSLCMIDAPMANNEAVVALNLYAPAEGEYTLSVEEQADATVYLLYNGNIVWNLSMGEYPITLKQGDNAGYSLLVRRADAPTSVETIEGANNQTDKLIYNGNLYILHNGKIFDAVGSLLK